MTITYPDGTRLQADLFTRTADTLQVAIQGQVATCEFTALNGAWISEDGDPVTIELHPDKRPGAVLAPDNSNRGKPLSNRLIARLLDPSDGDLLQELLSYLS